MSDDYHIEDPEEWVDRILANTTINVTRAESVIDSCIRKLSLDELARLTKCATEHEFDIFDDNFLSACISVQIGAEFKRRMQSVRDGRQTLDEIVTPPVDDPADQWGEHEPPAP